jgi:hypothetical protein
LPKPSFFKAATAAVRVRARAPRWKTAAKSCRVTNFFLIVGCGGACVTIFEMATTGTGAETLGAGGTESGGIKDFTAEGMGTMAGLAGISAGIGRKAGVLIAVSASFRRLGLP